ncbi:MAG: 50S ribosomal protein L29 [Armatimonadetes bacterium]|nr:50S ribosomal protein L29 [Armatimonadota bacterium]
MPEAKLKLKDLRESLRNLSEAGLLEALQSERERLFNLRRQNVTKQLVDPNALSRSRKQIARILTLLNEVREKGKGAAK